MLDDTLTVDFVVYLSTTGWAVHFIQGAGEALPCNHCLTHNIIIVPRWVW